jgi:hypothetical protein
MITNFKIFEFVDSKDVGSAYKAFLSVVNKDRLVAWISDFDEDLDIDYQMKKYPYLKKIQLFEKGTDIYQKALEDKYRFFGSLHTAREYLLNQFILYVKEGEEHAYELAQIIRRNNGSAVSEINDKYTIDDQIKDHIRVGELLEYNPDKIKEFLIRINIPIKLINKYL